MSTAPAAITERTIDLIRLVTPSYTPEPARQLPAGAREMIAGHRATRLAAQAY
ncbi:hypothetical protein GCM10027203_37400 [Nonomuraea fastidiosa]